MSINYHCGNFIVYIVFLIDIIFNEIIDFLIIMWTSVGSHLIRVTMTI